MRSVKHMCMLDVAGGADLAYEGSGAGGRQHHGGADEGVCLEHTQVGTGAPHISHSCCRVTCRNMKGCI